jgi:hypothetical protein
MTSVANVIRYAIATGRVPLSKQVVGLVQQLVPISGKSKFLFSNVRSNDRPISDNTINVALRRVGYDKTQMTARGSCVMASSLLDESRK